MDQPARFKAAGWRVQSVDGHDMEAVAAAIEAARQSDRPSLIACRTVIGKGAPNLGGSEKTHGAPLGDAPRDQAPAPKRTYAPRRDADDGEGSARRNESVRDSAGPKHRGKPHGEGKPKFGGKPDFGKKKKDRTRSGHSAQHAGHDWPQVAPSAKAAPGKKIKKKKRRD